MRKQLNGMGVWKFFSACYFVSLLYITLVAGKRHEINDFRARVNIDFSVEKNYFIQHFASLTHRQTIFVVEQVAGNFILFFPYMAMLYAWTGKKIKSAFAALLLLLLILSIESSQFIFNVGVFDIDDIVLNFTGGLLGIALFNFIHSKYHLQ